MQYIVLLILIFYSFHRNKRSGSFKTFSLIFLDCKALQKNQEMNIENTQAQMRKGILEYCILLIIARNDAYVQDIINKLRASKMLVVEGTVYPLLTRLKNTGLLAYRWEESTQGPPRKYYNITEQGRQFLQALETSWEELTTAIEILKAPHTPQ